ncbi:unnamed protein product [Cylindrotheca closterium]|uniref:Uncharacterized protein n=1 Tax=Cylindrotheca closterium TaxID=2856 RepID=A0AAD2PTY1_9STRA|nr:unnamed protein product [Cylindrotheca closterium]
MKEHKVHAGDSCTDDTETPHIPRTAIHETIVSNPGITERLEQDIGCFARYGFSFRRDDETGNGVLVSPLVLPTASSFARLQITVSDVSLVASIGPFLRTLVRLCVHPIRPQSLLATVVIKGCIGSSGSSSSRRRTPARKEVSSAEGGVSAAAARSVAHAIHMLIRNSMGAALFLRLKVVLPGAHGEDGIVVLKRDQVLLHMQRNDDGCYEYPSVEICDHDDHIMLTQPTKETPGDDNARNPFSIDLGLVEDFEGAPPSVTKPLQQNCLHGYDPSCHFLDLTVSTRMCTVRLTPLLYDLSQRLLLSLLEGNIGEANVDKGRPINGAKRSATLMICLEKVSNLYRVLMLLRDYSRRLFQESEGDTLAAEQPQLVIICKSEDVARRFDSEAQKFISKNFIDQKSGKKTGRAIWTPRVLSVAQAVEFVTEEVAPSPVVGFDLDDGAVTLSEANSDAKRLLATAGAVLLGYESDGIPKELDKKLTDYVQIDSRTSINVVAAFSILCHLILN